MKQIEPGRCVGVVGVLSWVMAWVVGAGGAAGQRVLVADRAVMPDGSLAGPTAVFIGSDGRITRVAEASAADGAAGAVRYGEAVLCPGLIDPASVLGVSGADREVMAIDTAARAIDGLDAYAGALADAARAGVTGAGLVPGVTETVTGRGAAIWTLTASGRAEAMVEDGSLIVSIGDQTADNLRGPSSRSGALFLLREAMAKAGLGAGGGGAGAGGGMSVAGDAVLRSVLEGRRGVVMYGPTVSDVAVGLELFSGVGVEPVVMTRDEAGPIARDLSGVLDRAGVFVVGPYDAGDPEGVLRGAAALAGAGAEVAITGRLGGGDAGRLRLGAVLAARSGLGAEAARRAITSSAARAAGVGGATGELAVGRWADVAVFSDDPLRLDAGVVAVFVKGELVHGTAGHAGSWRRR